MYCVLYFGRILRRNNVNPSLQLLLRKILEVWNIVFVYRYVSALFYLPKNRSVYVIILNCCVGDRWAKKIKIFFSIRLLSTLPSLPILVMRSKCVSKNVYFLDYIIRAKKMRLDAFDLRQISPDNSPGPGGGQDVHSRR